MTRQPAGDGGLQDTTADDLNAAFAVGVDWMQGEDFCEQDFMEWYFEYSAILDTAMIAAAFDLALPYDYQWLMISCLGMAQDESVWETLTVAYEDGDEQISDLAYWALVNLNPVRLGLNTFFKDLAVYARAVCMTTPQQMQLF